MLEEFLTSVEILVTPAVKVYDEDLEVMVVTEAAEFRTQTVLANRPETKTQEDLDRIIKQGKPRAVVDKFAVMVDLGNAWDWLDEYLAYLNDEDTYAKWKPIYGTFDYSDVEVQVNVKPSEPVLPIRRVREEVNYAALRAKHYPELSEFADAFVHRDKGDLQPMIDYIAKCQAVKDKYPK